MNSGSRHSQNGSLILLVMCLLAVLGIALAGYLAVSNQSMRFSNRAYAKDVSRHLAEMGLERALRSFGANTFSSWTLSGNTATRTFTISSSRYGTSGITGTVNVRVDNYNIFFADAVWDNATNYRMDQFVLRSGSWYRAFSANINSDPTSGASWSIASGSAPAAWNTGTYNLNDVVNRSGVWYRCIQTHANQAPPNSAFWSTAPLLPYAWTNGAYSLNNVVYDRGIWYRCILAHASGQRPPNSTYWASAATSNWSSSTAYVVNDYVSYSGVWYRCITNHTNQTPNNNTYWAAVVAPVIYAEGVATLPDSAGTTIKTQLRAVVGPTALFPNAAAAATNLVFSSGGTVDSYDSVSDPAPSTFGFSAILAGGNTAATAVTVTSTTVQGYLAAPSTTTTPFAPRVSVGASASLRNSDGTVTSPHPTAMNVDLTRISRSPYIPQFSRLTPNSGTFTTLPSSTATLGSANDTTWQTYVFSGNLNITDSRIYTIDGPVRIIVTGYYYQNLSGGSASIIITNNNTAKLEMYISGDIALYGGGIDNRTRLPKNLAIYASTTSSAPDFNTSTPFYGVIYFSNSSSRFTVLGNRTFYGALSGANLTFSASPIIHYDTSLRYTSFSGTDTPCTVTEWRELTDAAELATMP